MKKIVKGFSELTIKNRIYTIFDLRFLKDIYKPNNLKSF